MRHFYFFLLSVWLAACTPQAPRINGVSFVASGEAVTPGQVTQLRQLNANYAALMPFGFVRAVNDPNLVFNSERQWFGEREEGVRQYIGELRKQGIEVMLKPQLWIYNGRYTGHMEMDTEAHWKQLEEGYRDFILTYAKLAAQEQVPLFCIGTELERFIAQRPEFWAALIAEVKTVYSGQLTYAANWDEYKRVPFWEDLDFIGVDAYFPVSDSGSPSIAEARAGWQPWKQELQSVSEKYGRPILFTEYGYRSAHLAGKEPWDSTRDQRAVDLEAQSRLLTALYEEFWDEPWMAGGFLWKWFIAHDAAGGDGNSFFTPQNKPAEEVVRAFYGK